MTPNQEAAHIAENILVAVSTGILSTRGGSPTELSTLLTTLYRDLHAAALASLRPGTTPDTSA